MLELFARHGLFDLELKAEGDLEIDGHHTVEDIGICLGKAIDEAIGDKAGIKRYGTEYVPMDEALVMVSLDLSGRAYLNYELDLPQEKVGEFDTELVLEFMRALAFNGGITLHIRQLAGENAHHIIEATFKALGRALRKAVEKDERITGVMSTKGKL
jgi:imidazoleglycerol-phosphate dehydratase